MGDVTLADFLETHNLVPRSETTAQLYLGTPTEGDIPGAQAFAATLRAAGGRVFVNLSNRSLGDQVKDAVKREIPLFVAYGSEESRSQSLRVKSLATSEESVQSVQELTQKLTSD
jgi:histidyl-tRNA synthetase